MLMFYTEEFPQGYALCSRAGSWACPRGYGRAAAASTGRVGSLSLGRWWGWTCIVRCYFSPMDCSPRVVWSLLAPLGVYYHQATQVSSLQFFSYFLSWAARDLGTVFTTVYCVFYLYLSTNLCIYMTHFWMNIIGNIHKFPILSLLLLSTFSSKVHSCGSFCCLYHCGGS